LPAGLGFIPFEKPGQAGRSYRGEIFFAAKKNIVFFDTYDKNTESIRYISRRALVRANRPDNQWLELFK
jgi:hypothetical protein|tara:strand:+ start:261 stop:467 length:207 start_codon:yes stop_codon:yes gene_type:complete